MNIVSVVIATTCEASRRTSLMNAIQSVLSQKAVETNVIAVVNGNRIDPECLEQLRNMPRVEVVMQAVGSYPRALHSGRARVQAPFFAFLDDDDEYLPCALEQRIALLLADPTLDLVASNGLRRSGGCDYPVVKRPESVHLDPLLALANGNWLASCGGLFRTSTVGIDYFDGATAHLEWTFLAYKLALTRRFAFVDQPTFVIHNSPGSLSKSDAYAEAEAHVLPKILALNLPKPVRSEVRRKLGRALHNIATRKIARGERWQAWRYHVASVCCLGGSQYLLFTRKLMLPKAAKHPCRV